MPDDGNVNSKKVGETRSSDAMLGVMGVGGDLRGASHYAQGREAVHFHQSFCKKSSRALHWAPTPTPITTHAHGFWVGMGAIFKCMGGHSCGIIVHGWAWMSMAVILLGIGLIL